MNFIMYCSDSGPHHQKSNPIIDLFPFFRFNDPTFNFIIHAEEIGSMDGLNKIPKMF